MCMAPIPYLTFEVTNKVAAQLSPTPPKLWRTSSIVGGVAEASILQELRTARSKLKAGDFLGLFRQ